MNTQAPVHKDDNSKKKFNDFKPYLDKITRHVLLAQDHLRKHDQAVFEALGCVLDLGHVFSEKRKDEEDNEWTFFKDFLEAHGERWTAKCEMSIFHGLVSVAFNQVDAKTKEPLNSAPTLSRYRAVLRFAFQRGLSGDELIAELKKSTLNEFYSNAVSHFRYDPLDRYVEDDNDRFLRSVRHLFRQRELPVIQYSDALPKPSSVGGYATALVRVRKGSMQLVGFPDESRLNAQEMRLKVASLVPAEASRRRKKLSDKKYYRLYVTCDLYTRFLPRMADQLAWARAAKEAQVPSLDAGASASELEGYIAAQSHKGNKRKVDAEQLVNSLDPKTNPGSLMKKFALLDALQFKPKNGDWVAETITTHPSTPCIEVTVPRPAGKQGPENTVSLKGLDAARLVKEFPQFEDWSFKSENGIGTLRDKGGRAASAKLQDLSHLALWRSVDQSLSSIARFRIGQEALHDLEHWRADYAKVPRLGRRAFQSIVELIVDDDGLKLVHPLDPDHSRVFGKLISDIRPVFDTPRFFDFRFCETLVQLALDYGTTFEFELMKGRDGPAAVRVYPLEFPVLASVTIPLMISKNGNPAEITTKLE
jgi:hypothetical protein